MNEAQKPICLILRKVEKNMSRHSQNLRRFRPVKKSPRGQSHKVPAAVLVILLSGALGVAHALDPQPVVKSSTKSMDTIMASLLEVGSVGRAVTIPLSTPKAAQDAAIDDMVTLGRSLALADSHSDALGAAQASANSARWAARSTAGHYGPRLDVQIQGGHEHSTSSDETAKNNPIALPNHTRVDSTVVLRQPVIDIPALQAYRRDDKLAAAASDKRDQTQTDVFFETAQAFDQLLQFQLLIDLAQEHRERMQSLLGYMTRRAAGGGATHADRDRVYAMSLAADRDMVDARSQYERAQVAYVRLTRVRPSALLVSPIKTLLPDTPEEAIDQMLAVNPGLQGLRKQIEAADYDRASTRAGVLPKVAIEAGDYYQRNASGISGSTRDKRVMLVMSMNVFSGGSDYSAARAQAEQINELKLKLDDTVAKARERLTVNYLALDSVRLQLSIAREENKANSQVAKAFDAQMASANRSLLDVLDTYQKLYQSRVSIVKLFVAERQATYQVLKDVGTFAALYDENAKTTATP